MNITYYISIYSMVMGILSILTITYLLLAFVKNIGLTKHLTRQDFDELYQYQWTEEELESLNDILIDRKRIIRYIGVFLIVSAFSVAIFLNINKVKDSNIEEVNEILQIIYTNDPQSIGDKLDEKSNILSEHVYKELNPNNIDTLQNRYSISNHNNEIRIINSTLTDNTLILEYQIESNDILISTRRLKATYINGKIVEFDEYIMVPVNYVQESGLGQRINEELDKFDTERKRVYEEQLENTTENDFDTELPLDENSVGYQMRNQLTEEDLKP